MLIKRKGEGLTSVQMRDGASAGQIRDWGYVLLEEGPPLEHVVMVTGALVMCQSSQLPRTHVIEVNETT